MNRQAWIDEHGILIGHGFMTHVDADGKPSFQHVQVDDDFNLRPLQWRYDDGVWTQRPLPDPHTTTGVISKCLSFARRILRR